MPNEEALNAVKKVLNEAKKEDLYLEIHPIIFMVGAGVVHLKPFVSLKEKRPFPAKFEHAYPDSSDSDEDYDEISVIKLKIG